MNSIVRRTSRQFSQSNRMGRVYKTKRVRDLLNSYFIFYFSQFDFLIDRIDSLAEKSRKLLGDRVFFGLLKSTMGRQFTAGESLEEALPVVNKLQEDGFHIALNYMAEFIKERNDPSQLDVNLQRYLNTFSMKAHLPGKDFFNAVKLSALIDFDLLKEVNKRQVFLESLFFKHFDKTAIELGNLELPKVKLAESIKEVLPDATDAEINEFLELVSLPESKNLAKISLIEWRLSANCYNTLNEEILRNAVYRKLVNYSNQQEIEIQQFVRRIDQIVQAAKKQDCFVLADAEQSYLQFAINNFVEQMMYLHNTNHHKPVIFNTVQNYLIGSGRYIRYELAKVEFFGPEYPVALKLVRGAYLDEEINLTKRTGIDVVYTKKIDTDNNYNANCEAIVQKMTPISRLVVATHNRDSVYQIADIIEKRLPSSRLADLVYFASLYGLNEPLGYMCIDRGFKAVKYLPYGEKEIILPYLLRRGKESKQLIKHDKDQLEIIRKELLDRIKFR